MTTCHRPSRSRARRVRFSAVWLAALLPALSAIPVLTSIAPAAAVAAEPPSPPAASATAAPAANGGASSSRGAAVAPSTAAAPQAADAPSPDASAAAAAAASPEAAPLAASAQPAPSEIEAARDAATAAGVTIVDLKVGKGEPVRAGATVRVHYTGWLQDGAARDGKGKKFDSSRDRGEPFLFPLGQQRVIRGWELGVAGMQRGGKRRLVIPDTLAYGARGAGGVIPPHATLVFDVELIDFEPP